MCDLNAVGDGGNTRNASNCSCEMYRSGARVDEEAVARLEETGSVGRDPFLLVALRQQPVRHRTFTRGLRRRRSSVYLAYKAPLLELGQITPDRLSGNAKARGQLRNGCLTLSRDHRENPLMARVLFHGPSYMLTGQSYCVEILA